VSEETKKDLEDQLTQHVMEGDLVGVSQRYNRPPGELREYRLESAVGSDFDDRGQSSLKPAGEGRRLTKDEVKSMGLMQKALFAHHIDHFTDRGDKLETNTVMKPDMTNKDLVAEAEDMRPRASALDDKQSASLQPYRADLGTETEKMGGSGRGLYRQAKRAKIMTIV
jgi:hypothetical protein